MHTTRLIILRTVRYGETSLVVTAFTELFGLQTYMVNGVRTAKKTGAKAILYQPASLLEAEVYHNEKNSLQRIREASRALLYQHLQSDVLKNSIAVFMMELLYKLLKQPEPNPELFYFCEDSLRTLDEAPPGVAGNFPLFFITHLSHFFGFRIDDNYSDESPLLDLREGNFVSETPPHGDFVAGEDAALIAELLRVAHPTELLTIKLNQQKRRELMARLIQYYMLHNKDFGTMKTLVVMQEVLG